MTDHATLTLPDGRTLTLGERDPWRIEIEGAVFEFDTLTLAATERGYDLRIGGLRAVADRDDTP